MEVTAGSEVRAVSGQTAGPILALDTSTDRAVVAVARADGSVEIAPATGSPRHGRGLLANIRDLLRQADLRLDQLAAIGVGLGPGSFTGLRIGVTAAKTLAYALECPLYGFDSLEAIARAAPGEFLRVVAIGDAQRGDLFAAHFRREFAGSPLHSSSPTRLERLETFANPLEPGTIIVGPGLGRAEPTWPTSVIRGDPEAGHPDGRGLVELTRELRAGGEPLDPWFLEPAYIRRSAAEEKGTLA